MLLCGKLTFKWVDMIPSQRFKCMQNKLDFISSLSPTTNYWMCTVCVLTWGWGRQETEGRVLKRRPPPFTFQSLCRTLGPLWQAALIKTCTPGPAKCDDRNRTHADTHSQHTSSRQAAQMMGLWEANLPPICSCSMDNQNAPKQGQDALTEVRQVTRGSSRDRLVLCWQGLTLNHLQSAALWWNNMITI